MVLYTPQVSHDVYYDNISKVHHRVIFILSVFKRGVFSKATSRERTEGKPLCVRLWTATPS